MSNAPLNPIEQRLDQLQGIWTDFTADPGARLGRWLIQADERRMLHAFVEVESDESGSLPDLFIRLEEPFAEPARYGRLLAQTLRAKYEEIRTDLRDEGLPADWQAPAVGEGEADIPALVKVWSSLAAHYQALISHVVLVLQPDRLKSRQEWATWLQQLVRANLPTQARVMVVDEADAPMLAGLAEAEPDLVRTLEPKLDMPAAFLELARGSGKGGPGLSFRMNFVALTQTAATGDVAKAQQLAATALGIAQQQGWPQLQAVIHMTLAATLLGAKKASEAVACYRQAAGVMANQPNDPAAPKIILQSKLSEGGALFSDGKYSEAARVYEESAALAEQQQNFLMAMEGWRMAAHCHQAAKQLEPGWRCGNKALDAAAKMEPDLRASSTLPFVGQQLLSLAKGANKEYAEQARARMNQIAGPDWEQKLAAASQPV